MRGPLATLLLVGEPAKAQGENPAGLPCDLGLGFAEWRTWCSQTSGRGTDNSRQHRLQARNLKEKLHCQTPLADDAANPIFFQIRSLFQKNPESTIQFRRASPRSMPTLHRLFFLAAAPPRRHRLLASPIAWLASGSTREKLRELRANYGRGFLVYWTGAWTGTGLALWGAVEWGGVDCLESLSRIDAALGSDFEPYVTRHVNPKLGNAALVLAVNETLEVVRLPTVIATTPTVVNVVRRLFRR